MIYWGFAVDRTAGIRPRGERSRDEAGSTKVKSVWRSHGIKRATRAHRITEHNHEQDELPAAGLRRPDRGGAGAGRLCDPVQGCCRALPDSASRAPGPELRRQDAPPPPTSEEPRVGEKV